MESIWQDLRYGLKMLIKNPGFTVLAVLTLALGICANTALFSLADQMLLRTLPVNKPEELVILRSPGPMQGRISSDGDSTTSFSYPMYKEIRDRNNIFTGVMARYPVSLSISGNGQTERADGELVTGNYFEVLGVNAAVGRVFTQEDDRVPGGHPVIVISHGFWQRRFGSDPSILNKSIIINSTPMTVVGITPANFKGIQIGQLPDVYVPMMMKPQVTPNWNGLTEHTDAWLAVIGRLKPGLTREQAQVVVEPVYRAILTDVLPNMGKWSEDAQKRFVEKKLLLDEGAKGRQILQRDFKQPLLILMGMVALVLLIACTNVANLLIARGAAREREIAIRMALGAGRWRLVRQFLVETILLFIISGGVGLIIAAWSIAGLVTTLPTSFGAQGFSADLNLRILGFNLIISVMTGLLFGLLPALRATKLNIETTLREQGLSVAGSISHMRFRKMMVVSQILLTVVMLVIAGLFARSFNNLKQLELGLKSEQLVTFSIAPELNGYSPERTINLINNIRDGLAAVPGVTSVSAATIPLFTDSNSNSNITAEGYQATDKEDMHVSQNWIGPEYFATMGIPLINGREFSLSDNVKTTKVAVINETMAKRYFNNDAIGKHFAFGAGNGIKLDVEIVGIVKDSKHSNVRDEKKPFAYLPYTQKRDLGTITFYLRSSQSLNDVSSALRSEIARHDNNLPIYDLKALQGQINESIYADRVLTFLSVCFGLLSSTLAAIGLYGVMAYTVTRRTREIGIRMALGATQGNISWLILKEVLMLLITGLAIGLPIAFLISRYTESLLFGVKISDPIVFVVATVLLTCMAIIGGFVPARKATKVDPMVALRYD